MSKPMTFKEFVYQSLNKAGLLKGIPELPFKVEDIGFFRGDSIHFAKRYVLVYWRGKHRLYVDQGEIFAIMGNGAKCMRVVFHSAEEVEKWIQIEEREFINCAMEKKAMTITMDDFNQYKSLHT